MKNSHNNKHVEPRVGDVVSHKTLDMESHTIDEIVDENTIRIGEYLVDPKDCTLLDPSLRPNTDYKG